MRARIQRPFGRHDLHQASGVHRNSSRMRATVVPFTGALASSPAAGRQEAQEMQQHGAPPQETRFSRIRNRTLSTDQSQSLVVGSRCALEGIAEHFRFAAGLSLIDRSVQQGVEWGLWRTATWLGRDWPALGGLRKWAVLGSGFPGWGQISHGRLEITGITAYLEHLEAGRGSPVPGWPSEDGDQGVL